MMKIYLAGQSAIDERTIDEFVWIIREREREANCSHSG